MVEIEYRNWNADCGIAALFDVVLGEPQHLGIVSGLRLEWLDFTPEEQYSLGGPRHGSTVFGAGNLVAAPIKPSAGLSPAEAAYLAYEAAVGGAHIIKDDELAFPGLSGGFVDRVQAVGEAVRRAEEDAGEPKFYWANLVGSTRRAFERAQRGQDLPVDGLLVAPTLQGLDICGEGSWTGPRDIDHAAAAVGR